MNQANIWLLDTLLRNLFMYICQEKKFCNLTFLFGLEKYFSLSRKYLRGRRALKILAGQSIWSCKKVLHIIIVFFLSFFPYHIYLIMQKGSPYHRFSLSFFSRVFVFISIWSCKKDSPISISSSFVQDPNQMDVNKHLFLAKCVWQENWPLDYVWDWWH